MRQVNLTALNAADLSQNQASQAYDASFFLQVSAQAVITGSSPHGTLKLQGSNDFAIDGDLSPFTPTNWNDIGSSVSISATGTYLIPALDICYSFIRLVWTASSGTGAITAHIKTVGA